MGSGNGDERGLLGLAFHPDYATNRRLYLYYWVRGGGGCTRVSELTVGVDGGADVSALRTIITIDQPQGNHNGGGLLFGSAGDLFVFTGDGGGGKWPRLPDSGGATGAGVLVLCRRVRFPAAGRGTPPLNDRPR